jgi:hypothetical protein
MIVDDLISLRAAAVLAIAAERGSPTERQPDKGDKCRNRILLPVLKDLQPKPLTTRAHTN